MTSTTMTPRQQAILIARKWLEKEPVYIDTETTGLDRNAEIVEIAIVDNDGSVIFDSLVKPRNTIPQNVMAVHHITNEMVASAPSWPRLWPDIRSVLFGRSIGFYNENFDMRMIQQTHTGFGLEWKEQLRTFCIMKLYAQFRAEWDPRRRSFKYHKLEAAGRQCGIPLPNTHRAADDTLLTRELMHYIANTKL